MNRAFSLLSPLIRSSRSTSFLSLYGQTGYCWRIFDAFSTEIQMPVHETRDGAVSKEKSSFITFVLGGPGCGKGTQCMKIADTFGFTHISAGDLLRNEISSNSKNGVIIYEIIKEGRIVPSDVTVKLISEAIRSTDNSKFLIDGFPRTEENRVAYERIIGAEPNMVLFFDCPEEIMLKRALGRNQGRVDDNENTIKKRLEVFRVLNLPVINYYSKRGILYKINATGSEEEIFEQVRPIFAASEALLIIGALDMVETAL